MFYFCSIYIASFNIAFITMFIGHYGNEPLHVTTPRVSYIYISSANVNMCVYHIKLQLFIIIKSWPTQTEKFLSPTLMPWTIISIYKYASCYNC